jgi:hypothetical protein
MSRWRSPNPPGAAQLFGNAGISWWIAGGWAIELFTGIKVRDHSDLEVGCFRADVELLLDQLPGWDLFIARDGRLEPLGANSLTELGVHSIWCRPSGSEHWVIEILIEERDGMDWTYRRDRRIRHSIVGLASRSREGLPYLCPEIQLLYKSKESRPKDDADFAVAWPLLDANAKAWLAAAVCSVSPSCAWNMAGQG